ncbi:hypothetical protein [Mucilaginibacter ginkgonis]|uniref:Uncharacterized protein n=1 Tax=Mucilaginibacter ginkgonis TaxID=2682091 RepID=A0A6I4HXH6_9SPHI|nr:hypothetical protein [Mucilaginibacter ginkgonis]QQL49278.1 hypothetical protein GO620_014015 [Mucilaginibacter ginkgonis]
MSNLYYITILIVLLDSLIGLYAIIVNKLERNIVPLALAVLCSLLDEVLAHFFKVKFRNNLPVYFLGGACEYALFAWFIYRNVNSRPVKKFIAGSIVLLVAVTFMLGYPFIKESTADPYGAIVHNGYSTIIRGLLITIISIFYFKGIFDSISRYEYLNVYVLLAVSGMLFYYAFSTVYFSAQTYMVGLSLKENPNFLTDMLQRKAEAYSYAAAQLHGMSPFLWLTNLLHYLCILVVFVKSAFGKKTVGELQF